MSDNRPLGYRLRQQAGLSTDIQPSPSWFGDSWPTTNPDEVVGLYITLSLNEWVKIASSVDVGSDIAYEDAVGLQFLLQRIIQVDALCDAISQCITDSEAVQEAIENATGNGVGGNTIITNTQYSNTTLISGAAQDDDCSNDAKFGRIVEFIEFVDEVQQDFYESIDAATNVLGQVGALVSAIPLVETLPIDEIIEFVGDTGELWSDSYLASVNTQLKESFACDLWCGYSGECELTVRMVIDQILLRYDIATTTGALNVLSLSALLGRIALTVAKGGGLAYIGDDLVYLSWLLQLVAVEASGEFFGVNLIDYASNAAQGTDNTNWTLCGCTSGTLDIDFSASGDDFVITSGVLAPSFGNPAPCAGAGGVPCGNDIFSGDLRLTIESDQNANISLTRVEFDLWYECVITGTQRPRWRVRLFDDNNNLIENSGFILPNPSSNKQWNHIVWTASSAYTNVRRVEVQAAKFDTSTFSRQRQLYYIDNIQTF